ncbi:hypothetical protein Cni_G14316 [Canna indica]|uniref:Uncharacterized protein n=1 Tax=Canna indica TaxID=4628 RepID=A0AAQ3KBP0_9LILI|nr:hypothetical protein Cni_G14316 [Canna indica]
MQRQSLGSPTSKIQLSAAAGGGGATSRAARPDEEEIKAEKQIRCTPKVEKSIHLVPLLTLLCLLILFLISHDPSSEDMEVFGGGSGGVMRYDDAKAVAGAERASAIHSNRRLKEALAAAEGGAVHSRKLGITRPGART